LLPRAPVALAADCSGVRAAEAIVRQKAGEVVLLENVRFHPGETENDLELARELASMGEIYVNDAFGTAHRAHASIAGIPQFLPSAMGLLFERELQATQALLGSPKKPFMLLLGGHRASEKIAALERLIPRLDALLLGGAVGLTFLAAREASKPTSETVGKSVIEPEKLGAARELLSRAHRAGCKVLLPVDHVVLEKDGPGLSSTKVVEKIGPEEIAVEIGPETSKLYMQELSRAATVLWNGVLGALPATAKESGTGAVAVALGEVAARKNATIVAAGGETADVAERLDAARHFAHVSTGGGAFLEVLSGRELPGIAALER
jgi:phosphoglycerate kinase